MSGGGSTDITVVVPAAVPVKPAQPAQPVQQQPVVKQPATTTGTRNLPQKVPQAVKPPATRPGVHPVQPVTRLAFTGAPIVALLLVASLLLALGIVLVTTARRRRTLHLTPPLAKEVPQCR